MYLHQVKTNPIFVDLSPDIDHSNSKWHSPLHKRETSMPHAGLVRGVCFSLPGVLVAPRPSAWTEVLKTTLPSPALFTCRQFLCRFFGVFFFLFFCC